MTDYREQAEYWEDVATRRGKLLDRVGANLEDVYYRGARDMAHEIADYLEDHVGEDKYKHLSGDVLDVPAPVYKEQ